MRNLFSWLTTCTALTGKYGRGISFHAHIICGKILVGFGGAAMSRVFWDQKYVNMPRHSQSGVGPSKVVRIHSTNEDYHKAPTLSAWLFMEYDMKYTSFRRKSVATKQKLRLEYESDTGI